ncbi:MAG TPA: hypothetical protein VGI79_16180 [Caulobacteraceae bacterium]|jgi:hypothetical protein
MLLASLALSSIRTLQVSASPSVAGAIHRRLSNQPGLAANDRWQGGGARNGEGRWLMLNHGCTGACRFPARLGAFPAKVKSAGDVDASSLYPEIIHP